MGRSCLWLGGEEEEEGDGKKRRKKSRKVTQRLHKKQSCNFSKIVSVLLVLYYPHQARDSVYAVYAGSF